MKNKSAFSSFMTRTAITLLVALLGFTQGAWATDFITDVKLIGGTKNEVNSLKNTYTSQGWKVIDYDLNKGCGSGSDYIYLMYKTKTGTINGSYITDFYIREGKDPPSSLTHKGRTYNPKS